MNIHRVWTLTALLACCLGAYTSQVFAADGAKFRDVLQTPAKMSPLSTKTLLQSVAKVGKRLVAVGQRGHILISSDDGSTWSQSKVPIASDLVAISAPDDRHIWVTGHDGVVLKSDDAGDSWRLQMEGEKMNALMVNALEQQLQAKPEDARLKRLLEEAQFYQKLGATMPLLGVWFADAKKGVVVGAYGLMLVTKDGGDTWESWFDVLDNPKFFHFNAVQGWRDGDGDTFYVAGEAGYVWQVSFSKRSSVTMKTPYEGSFFQVAVSKDQIVVCGMRGHVWYKSLHGGDWEKSAVNVLAGITDLHVSEKAIFLSTQNGKLMVSLDSARSFSVLAPKAPMVYAGLTLIHEDASQWKVAAVGVSGVHVETFPK